LPRILLLEDEETVRALMEHLLLGERYQVDVAGTLAQARTLLERHHYDLLLTDLVLPDGTGTIIAHEAQRSGTPAIIVTAYAARFPKADLAKPVRPAELLQAVAEALNPASDT
jgi:CheY-like chemotaxis protein